MSRHAFVHDDPAEVTAWCRSQVTAGAVYVASSAASRRGLLRSLTVGDGVAIGLAATTRGRLVALLEARAGLVAPRTMPPALERLLIADAARAARVPLFETGDAPRGARHVLSSTIRALRTNRVAPAAFVQAGGDARVGNAFERYEARRTALGYADEAERIDRVLGARLPRIAFIIEELTITDRMGLELFSRLVESAASCHVGLSSLAEDDGAHPVQGALAALDFEVEQVRRGAHRPAAMRAVGGIGALDEVEHVAREMLALLRAGVPAREVTAVTPSATYMTMLHAACGRLGIPVASPRRMPVLDVPLVRALRRAFTLLADEGADTMDEGLALLATPYVGLSLRRHDRVAASLVRQGLGAMRTWSRFAGSETSRAFRGLAAAVAPLAASLTGERAPRESAQVVTNLALEFNFLSSGRRAYLAAGRDDAVRLDQLAWNAVVAAIAELDDSLALAGVTRIGAMRWMAELVELLSDETVRVDARGLDGVLLTHAGAGIAPSRHVFALGWREGLVPRRIREAPLLPDQVKRALNAAGARLPLAADRPAVERERRERIVRAAREQLVVSWPAAGDDGNPQIASFYLDDLGITERQQRHVGDPTWPLGLAATRSERLARATAASRLRPAASLDGERTLVEAALTDMTRREAHAWTGARNAARTVTLSAAALQSLVPRAGEMSASQARTIAHCTYAHFGTKRLALAPLAAPELGLPEMGTIAHEVLAELGRAGMQPGDVERLLGTSWSRHVPEALRNDPRTEFELEVLRGQVMAVVATERALLDLGVVRAAHFELAFGLGREDAMRDPMSRDEGVALALPAGLAITSTTLRGSIDRVDILERDGRRFGVAIDYKSGKGESYRRDMEEMADFQLPIYCEAMRAFGIEPVGAFFLGIATGERHGVIVDALSDVFVPPASDGKGVKRLPADMFAAYVDARTDALRSQVARLVRGELEVRPRKNDCKYCELRPVCRVGTFGIGGAGDAE